MAAGLGVHVIEASEVVLVNDAGTAMTVVRRKICVVAHIVERTLSVTARRMQRHARMTVERRAQPLVWILRELRVRRVECERRAARSVVVQHGLRHEAEIACRLFAYLSDGAWILLALHASRYPLVRPVGVNRSKELYTWCNVAGVCQLIIP